MYLSLTHRVVPGPSGGDANARQGEAGGAAHGLHRARAVAGARCGRNTTRLQTNPPRPVADRFRALPLQIEALLNKARLAEEEALKAAQGGESRLASPGMRPGFQQPHQLARMGEPGGRPGSAAAPDLAALQNRLRNERPGASPLQGGGFTVRYTTARQEREKCASWGFAAGPCRLPAPRKCRERLFLLRDADVTAIRARSLFLSSPAGSSKSSRRCFRSGGSTR